MIPFSPPRIDQKIIDEVTDTLKSGWWTTGPKTKLFEQRLTDYCGNRKTFCVSSATAGLELMLRWFGVKEGDEVIIPAYTYTATANVVVHCGATPVMADVNEDFNISLAEIQRLITNKTKVIIPVDMAGMPCDYDEIMHLAKDSSSLFSPSTEVQKKLGRVLILSDSAHSIGGEYKGQKTGSLTDVSVFSFHAVKNLATAEGGGIALNLPKQFDCEELYKYLNTFSLHGQSKDALAKTQKGGWRYDVIEPGYKCNMTDIQASIGLVELERYESDTLKRRKGIFDRYSAGFSQYHWAQLPVAITNDKTSSYHIYMLRLNGFKEEQRDEVIQGIFDKDVSVNVHFQPLPLLTAYKSRGYKMEDYPKAFDNYQREITLPMYYTLTNEQVDEVIAAVVESVEKVLNNS
ncbi:MAG: DegT/DnrJ/EryC1/StrS family aminotransferase [Flavobacteriales bacterium]|nr:DegT/DnrJ/EryC1/StrS family aminotransferase [Flavobacteriales bacterium]